ncbi:hypothetical protein [Agreia bicolorata]|uniref:Tetratricopeptide repeat-containing protein n=1 Tax=Agreia bicolorata TaxID=110935 RepID=A0ABR5CIK7_9MICO|nr:hypothetical protein [Agreia bicolorata]KJC65498.1 hypothetical protein TZ00_01180 [Agreia bicolorata]
MMRRRTKAGLVALPPTVLATVVAVKLIGLAIVSGQVAAAYEREDFESATSMARWLTVVNVIDPWKAHFAVGDGLAAQGLDADAQLEFERALGLASAKDQCPVRVNLSLVLERQGDAVVAADPTKRDEASAFYDEALDVIDEADASCRQPPQNGEDGTDDDLSDSEKRVTEKKQALAERTPEDEGDKSDEQPKPDGSPSDATVDQLEEKLREAGQDRNDQQTAERTPADPDYVDKPW